MEIPKYVQMGNKAFFNGYFWSFFQLLTWISNICEDTDQGLHLKHSYSSERWQTFKKVGILSACLCEYRESTSKCLCWFYSTWSIRLPLYMVKSYVWKKKCLQLKRACLTDFRFLQLATWKPLLLVLHYFHFFLSLELLRFQDIRQHGTW